jgi:hypothetical protein
VSGLHQQLHRFGPSTDLCDLHGNSEQVDCLVYDDDAQVKRTLVSICVVVAGLVLAACSSGPTHGTVLEKKYTPGYTYTYQQPISHESCTEEPDGPNGEDEDVCSTYYTYIPEQRYQPPEWQIELQSDGKTGWVDVSHSVYNGTHKGDYYGSTTG